MRLLLCLPGTPIQQPTAEHSLGDNAAPVAKWACVYGWAWMREMVLVVWLVAQIAVPAGAIA
jgi:hypothetical protein